MTKLEKETPKDWEWLVVLLPIALVFSVAVWFVGVVGMQGAFDITVDASCQQEDMTVTQDKPFCPDHPEASLFARKLTWFCMECDKEVGEVLVLEADTSTLCEEGAEE